MLVRLVGGPLDGLAYEVPGILIPDKIKVPDNAKAQFHRYKVQELGFDVYQGIYEGSEPYVD